ncbi:MAG: hypothetical protein DMG57_27330 [Acidobacteria bacterium]|nr:MAG: hypothetical protein DMG57_27330 [Acidobacteriota bacterium]
MEASDGEQAMRVFKENTAAIDLVFLDMTMPGISGPRGAETDSKGASSREGSVGKRLCSRGARRALSGQAVLTTRPGAPDSRDNEQHRRRRGKVRAPAGNWQSLLVWTTIFHIPQNRSKCAFWGSNHHAMRPRRQWSRTDSRFFPRWWLHN